MADLIIAQQNSDSPFDSIRHWDSDGEYWLGRELMPLLGYEQWRRFSEAVDRAIVSQKNCGNSTHKHFLPTLAKSNGRPKQDYRLSRLACYLTAMNGDPRKEQVAAAQTYFAIKTRQSEIADGHQLPQSFAEALQLAADQAKEIELQQAQIKLLQEDNERQAEAIDELFDYSSIIRIAKFNQCSEKEFSWHRLKAASQALGVEIKKVPCPRFVTKNLYSHDAWRVAYPECKLPETTTLRLA